MQHRNGSPETAGAEPFPLERVQRRLAGSGGTLDGEKGAIAAALPEAHPVHCLGHCDGSPCVADAAGAVLHQYNLGSMTRRTPGNVLASEDVLELAPDDARALAIDEGAEVEIESLWGSTRARARASDRIAGGTAFLSFHHPETHANALTGPQRDADSNCPEYKVTAVRIRPVAR